MKGFEKRRGWGEWSYLRQATSLCILTESAWCGVNHGTFEDGGSGAQETKMTEVC